MHIPTLVPEVLGHIGKINVTNTMINAVLATSIFLVVGILIKKSINLRPSGIQNFFEHILEMLMEYFDQVTGDRKKTLRFLPVVGSVFFFILLSNWLGLLPGTGSLTWNHKMILRPANTDLNLTLAMALVSVIVSHIFGFITVGFFTYFNKFIQIGTLIKSFKHGPIAIFTAVIEMVVGLIELVGEAAKVLSLSLRLFGNIFAGEVLISVISAIAGLLIPTPFMMLELLVGLIQASVFAMLTLVYLSVATMEVHGESEH
ncbi:MAG: F0F1 ATP synthase subunit A [Candidatus Magasanikbacteria bacterium]|nr:F0F1 ATP synthase subunit A [Candidatus Magasanikbacteria bacterium]